MTTLLILIRESGEPSGAVERIVRATGPYVEIFGGTTEIAPVRRHQELRGGDPVEQITAAEVTLSGNARVELPVLVTKLERFLKQALKDVEVAARFEILRVESAPFEPSPAIGSFERAGE